MISKRRFSRHLFVYFECCNICELFIVCAVLVLKKLKIREELPHLSEVLIVSVSSISLHDP